MRRPSAEWLLAPVFLLPVAVAVGALAWVRGDVLARLDTYGRDGAATALRWLDEQPEIRARHVAMIDGAVVDLPLTDAEPAFRYGVRFRRGDVSGVFFPFARPSARSGATPATDPPPGGSSRHEEAAKRADVPWVLGTRPLGGLSAAGLTDAAIRLVAETGSPIARSAGADPTAVAFAELLAAPSLDRLGAADLPASTKAYLVSRMPDAEPFDRAVAAALRDVDAALEDTGGQLGPGVHVRGSVQILASSRAPAIVVHPTDAPLRFEIGLVLTDPTGLATLVFEADPEPPDRVLWTGDLDPPLAGHWSIVLPHGRAWWRSTQAQRWVLPLAFACLAFLAVPTALLLAIRRRRRLDEARARFVTEIAHDLRTPVAALRLHADLLASGRVPEADRRKHEDVVGREAARLSSLLANLLDLSRLERGTRPFDSTLVDVADVVRDAVREFGSIHPLRAADVSVECPADLAALADRPALARIVANLLDNAGKFTEPGTAIRVRAEALGDRGVRLVVEDDGPGIAPPERARIFEPYVRGAAAATTAAPGTGLGLALVRDLARGMGGTVALRRTRSGASFEVALPGGTDD